MDTFSASNVTKAEQDRTLTGRKALDQRRQKQMLQQGSARFPPEQPFIAEKWF
jgi:hypothetical protein